MIENRLIQDIDLEAFDTQEFDKDEDFKNIMKEFLQAHNESSFEEKPRKVRKKKESNLESFMEDFDTTPTEDMPAINIEELMDE